MFVDTWKDIDSQTLRAFIGLLLLAGVYRSYGESTESLWHETKGRPAFRATMSLQRFQILSRVIRFDNRTCRVSNDKLAPIRTLWETWNSNLKRLFNVHENVTVDEQLVPFRGRCPFKQYMPKKPARYGIKIWTLCDSLTTYAWNMQIYTGKRPDGNPETNQGMRVVLDLTKGLKGINVTADNFFITHALGVELLKRKITLVGTVKKNKTFLPLRISDMKSERQFSSRFLFDNANKTTIVSYVPKKKRIVILLSTMHHETKINEEDAKMKPEIITYYNATKSAVDTLDQMVGNYRSKRQTRRWPYALFCHMIDLTALNAYILFCEVNPEWNLNKHYRRRIFIEELGDALIRPEIMRRRDLPRTVPTRELVNQIQRLEIAPNRGTSHRTRARCRFCVQSDNKHSTKCTTCNEFICKEHTFFQCLKCASSNE